jgi:hypothetical protein
MGPNRLNMIRWFRNLIGFGNDVKRTLGRRSGDKLYEVKLNLSLKGQTTFASVVVPVFAKGWNDAQFKANKILKDGIVTTAEKNK